MIQIIMSEGEKQYKFYHRLLQLVKRNELKSDVFFN